MKNVLHQLWGNWCHVYKIYWVCQWEKYSVSRPRLFSLDNQDYDSSFSEKPSEEWCTQTSLCLCMLVTQWCLTLCHPMDCSLPGSSIHGILQAKILEWLAIPFPRSSSWWRDPIRVSSTVGWRFFFFFFFIANIFFLNFTVLYWFCHTSTWIRHRYTCAPHPEPSSLLPACTIPPGRPSAPAPSIQHRASNLDWWHHLSHKSFPCHCWNRGCKTAWHNTGAH